jgi:hypothetical protein
LNWLFAPSVVTFKQSRRGNLTGQSPWVKSESLPATRRSESGAHLIYLIPAKFPCGFPCGNPCDDHDLSTHTYSRFSYPFNNGFSHHVHVRIAATIQQQSRDGGDGEGSEYGPALLVAIYRQYLRSASAYGPTSCARGCAAAKRRRTPTR